MPIRSADRNPSALICLGPRQRRDGSSAADDLERRRELGQFFTPPSVAAFAWQMLAVIRGDRFDPKTRVIDPACGEGVFLRLAAQRAGIAAEGLFGVDIDEKLAAVWQRDARLKGIRLFVGNGLMDYPDRGLQTGTFDVVVGNPPFAGKGVRDLLRLLEPPYAACGVLQQELFGGLILQERAVPASPPLTRRQRTELDRLARTLARYQCWRLTRAAENGEVPSGQEQLAKGWPAAGAATSPSRLGASDWDRAATAVAAWPLHEPLDPCRPETRLVLRRLASTAIEVFFMERFLLLAKPGGLLAVIVPDTILASDQLGPLRAWLLTQMELLAVVGLPQRVFAGVGANARTSMVFARRLGRPRSPTNGPDRDTQEGDPTPVGPAVLMATPNPAAPGFNLENYLTEVLRAAEEHAPHFPPEAT